MNHIDDTRAPEPLWLTSEWIAGELPETYPTGSSAGAAAPAVVACFDPALRFCCGANHFDAATNFGAQRRRPPLTPRTQTWHIRATFLTRSGPRTSPVRSPESIVLSRSLVVLAPELKPRRRHQLLEGRLDLQLLPQATRYRCADVPHVQCARRIPIDEHRLSTPPASLGEPTHRRRARVGSICRIAGVAEPHMLPP
jgi:hypothetical protein